MSFSRAIVQITVILAVTAFMGCVEDKDYGEANNLRPNVNRNIDVNANENVAEDNEEKLDTLVNLPFEPIENTFRESPLVPVQNSNRVPGPNDRRLTVVLRFSPEDSEKLIDLVLKDKAPFKTGVDAEPWFPAELKAKSETSGNQQLKGTGYNAESFAKSPWLNGSLIKIDDTDYFVLILQTK